MMPLTMEKPKVLIEVAGKPFLYYVLQNLRQAGFHDSEIFIMVSYKKEKVMQFIRENNFKVNLIDQENPIGTGHAVFKARKWIKEDFIVLMGDNLYSPSDIMKMAREDEFNYIAAFESNHPQDYGVLDVRSGKLVEIDEKPQNPKSKLVNVGLYKFTTSIFHSLERLNKSSRGEYEITDALNDLALAGKVKAIKLGDYWIDMSNKDSLPHIEKDIRRLFK